LLALLLPSMGQAGDERPWVVGVVAAPTVGAAAAGSQIGPRAWAHVGARARLRIQRQANPGGRFLGGPMAGFHFASLHGPYSAPSIRIVAGASALWTKRSRRHVVLDVSGGAAFRHAWGEAQAGPTTCAAVGHSWELARRGVFAFEPQLSVCSDFLGDDSGLIFLEVAATLGFRWGAALP